VDGSAVGGVLILFILASSVIGDISPARLQGTGPAFAALGLVIAALYFGFFGGIVGRTPGERLVGRTVRDDDGRLLTLADLRRRAIRAAMRDIRAIAELGTTVWAAAVGARQPTAQMDGERLAF
jgi:hypothetical protein